MVKARRKDEVKKDKEQGDCTERNVQKSTGEKRATGRAETQQAVKHSSQGRTLAPLATAKPT